MVSSLVDRIIHLCPKTLARELGETDGFVYGWLDFAEQCLEFKSSG